MRKEEGDLRRLLCKPKSIKILITERIEKRSKVMRLKKFLSAALSAAMLISCVSFGGGTVVQAAGEMNIARNLQISAYSGTEGDFPVSSVNDGRGDDTQNDNYRWFSKEALKGSGARGNAAYLIFDLGENGPRSFSGIDIRFHNMAYATNYKILTTDNSTITTESLLAKDRVPEGWKVLYEKTHQETDSAYPKDHFEGKTEVGRYVMFFFTSMNSRAGLNSVSVRKVQIWHKAITNVTMSASTLDLKAGDEAQQLTATVTPEDATYKAVEWSSNNDNIATVDASGNVTAVAPGQAVITATCKDDRTKQQHVPSAIDKTELTYWLEEAGKLNSSDYTKDGWDIFRQIVTEATGVKDDATATEHEVSEAVIALIDGMIALEKEKVYTVTVDGKKVAEGVYNQIVTITADAPQVGQKFAGWQLKDKIVSYDEVYTFAISGNMAFTATYAPQEQTIEKPLYAAVADTMIIKRADGKANVKYIAKLSIPDNYILNETGLLWYGKPDLENLCTETGPTPGTKKIVAPVISSTYQFAVNVNGIPAGKTIRGVIYAKVTDKETQQTKWVYSEEVRLTNK